ncbi:nuclear transport factor 2 family protein [Gilvimarinus sp. SDUM040013]|uniref:Nuclear transport factor 2 family protein n=1 Tax=Gilvimarinus gilvus TaxID=3058038 RepID=A0ABU4RZA5_9GAMM|nr:nuclear transport factor 2 family protein [Gilvimarinus sp. SDUM040013]MDO3387605.1 nuclear transport factor 2 family protein [Gilvimarinus sp. SDUM040013]MDX6850130.1 nuclear transport factor 2 family protein [Gilvimarinus sp. SDUM040013]
MFRFVKYALLTFISPTVFADCLAPTELKALDYAYEQAIRQADADFLENTLLPQYVWVHNHAVVYETKSMLLARVAENYTAPKSREQTEVSIRRQGNTAVVTGLSTVDKFTDGPRRANRYHYMRTWVKTEAGCQLLAAQTMKVWSTEE